MRVGKDRTVNIAKDSNMFCLVRHIASQLDQRLGGIRAESRPLSPTRAARPQQFWFDQFCRRLTGTRLWADIRGGLHPARYRFQRFINDVRMTVDDQQQNTRSLLRLASTLLPIPNCRRAEAKP
jgi:hypothetical protein